MHRRKNNKGFVLVESIVVAIFVLAFLTFLIVNLLPLIGSYESALNYDTVESRYNAHLIRKMILKDDFCKVRNLLNIGSNSVYSYFNGEEMCEYLEKQNYCHKLFSKEFLDVREVLITDTQATDLRALSDLENSTNNSDFQAYVKFESRVSREMRSYIKAMPSFPSVDSFAYLYQRRIIVRFGDGSITNVEVLLSDNTSLGCFGGLTCEENP